SAGLLMLAFSSLSRNSRYVGAMWFGFWIVSNLTSGVLTLTVRAEWCPVVSYTNNLRRVRDALLDAETAWDQVTSLFDEGRRQIGERVPFGPFGRARRIGPARPASRRPSTPPSLGEGPTPASSQEPRSPFAPATYPWQWSAGVLAALAALSV